MARLGVILLAAAVLTPAVGATAYAAGSTSSTQSLAAAVSVGREAAILVQLGVFTQANGQGLPPTVQALAVQGAAHAKLVSALRSTEAVEQRWLAALQAGGGQVFPPVQQVLTPLSAADLSNASAGQAISIQADAFMGALDSLLFDNGGPVTGAPHDPPTLQAALNDAVRQTAGVKPPKSSRPSSPGPGLPTAPPIGAPPATSGGHSSSLPVVGGVALALILGAAAFLWLRARRRVPAFATARIGAPAAPGPLFAQPVPSVVSPATEDAAQMSELLDVSRRLASITSVDEIHRVITREAMGLIQASSAALIVRDGDQLVVAHEARPGLLVPDRLADGAIGRVAETGQPTRQVSATEAAIRQLPAALLAVPLVAGGSVAAVLVMLRPADWPFSAEDSNLLMALTPVAAAAMHGAAETTDLMQRSLQDALTGVGNRSRFDRDLATVIADPTSQPVTLLMIDLDHFKAVNDTYGHPAGDALLRGLGGLLRQVSRPTDGVYRYGGEEFALLLPNTPSGEAADLAERVRNAVETNRFDTGAGIRLTATASIGVATVESGDGPALIALADAALYEAKRGGRNRVSIADTPA